MKRNKSLSDHYQKIGYKLLVYIRCVTCVPCECSVAIWHHGTLQLYSMCMYVDISNSKKWVN